jgi:hypothetical protein
MNATRRDLIMQRWHVIQHDLILELKQEVGELTPKLEKLIHILDWIRIEEWPVLNWQGIGRKPHDRSALANAFVAKAVLGLSSTRALIERLSMDRALKRLCGFSMWKVVPDEATFSRAFAEFAKGKLAERVHETLVKTYLGDTLIGHISRDGTAIEARERPARKAPATPVSPSCKKRRGDRVAKSKSQSAKVNRIAWQRTQPLSVMLRELPRACDRGTKCNAQGYQNSWNGYKLHIDTADCGVPVSVLLTSASVHDSQTAVPLATMTAERVTNLYDLMDAAYCSGQLQEHSRSLGHVPLIDHNARGGEKEPFEPADAVRYKERTQAERSNARLKDEFGGRHVRVRGPDKVMAHLMFGVLALTADQLMRLFT